MEKKSLESLEASGTHAAFTQEMKKHVSVQVTISDNAQKALFMDICQRCDVEACGVLLGDIDEQGNWQIEQAYPLRNIFDSAVYFEFDPEELLNVELTYPGQIVGVYHSHPGGFAAASRTDRGNMQRVNQEEQIPWVWLIICGPFDDAFVRRAQGRIPEDTVLAYHHYDEGLRRITILTAEAREKLSQKYD